MKIYIATSKTTNHILPIFCYLFNKYWGEADVNILGFGILDTQLPDNFNFISLAEEQIGGASRWTSYIRNYFSKKEVDNFIFGLDDSFIVREVNHESLKYIDGLMHKDDTIGRFDLTPGMQWATARRGHLKVRQRGQHKIVECLHSNQGKNLYRLSAAFSYWNRDYFLKFMAKDRSPWEWETRGSLEAESDSHRVYGMLDKWPVKKTEGLSNSQFPGKINTYHMREVDVQYIIENNLVIDKTLEMGNIRHEFEEWSYIPGWCGSIYGK